MGRQLTIAPNLTEEIQDWAYDFSNDAEVAKAYAGNKAAARRVRKKLLELNKMILPARKELLLLTKKRQ